MMNMVSDQLYALADRMSAYAYAGIPVPARLAACMAVALMDHARVVEVMETLPLDVSLRMLDAVPEYTIARAAHAPQRTAP